MKPGTEQQSVLRRVAKKKANLAYVVAHKRGEAWGRTREQSTGWDGTVSHRAQGERFGIEGRRTRPVGTHRPHL